MKAGAGLSRVQQGFAAVCTPARWHIVAAACLLCCPAVACADVLSAVSLQHLMAGGAEGTTITFQGGVDKVYYAPHLHNTLRRSPDLGANFIKLQLRPDTISEGIFIGTFEIDGRAETITGIAGISADKDTGRGVVLFIQTFADDVSKKDFETHDRLYSVLEISEADTNFSCRRSRWRKLLATRSALEFMPGPCEFLVGNSAVPLTRE